MYCSICGGILCLLGRLGNLVWCRCRNCGMDQHRTPEEVEDACCHEDE